MDRTGEDAIHVGGAERVEDIEADGAEAGRGGPEAPDGPEPSELEKAAAGLGTEIVRFARLVTAWRQTAKTDGRAAERVLLAKLVMKGDRRATDLAADAFLDLSTVSRQVRSLVERGLVERYPAPEDRRGSLLRATDAGREVFQEYTRQRDSELAAVLERWPAEDRTDLVRLMGRLNDDLERGHAAHHTHPSCTAPSAPEGEGSESPEGRGARPEGWGSGPADDEGDGTT